MEDILKKYKERLIKIGKGNISLSYKKLLLKSGFDIQKIEDIDNHKLESWLINRNQNKFHLITDPHKDYVQEYKVIEEKLNKEKDIELKKLKSKILDCELLKNAEEEIEKIFNQKIKEEQEKIEKKLNEKIGYIHNIKILLNEIKK